MRSNRGLWLNREGAAAVEFALVFPILLLVLMSIFELSWLLSTQTVLNHATFQAARAASKARSGGQTEAAAAQLARDRAVDVFWMGTLDSNDVQVTFDDSDEAPQVEVLIAFAYESLTGWFEAGAIPAELKSRAVTPY